MNGSDLNGSRRSSSATASNGSCSSSPPFLSSTIARRPGSGEHLEDFSRLGFEIEPFGGNAYVVKALPQLLGEVAVADLVRDVAGELATQGSSGLLEDALDGILIRMACHGMVRANQALGPVEIRALLRDLDRVDFRGHCPHGRPVMKRLTLGEIERMFKRS